MKLISLTQGKFAMVDDEDYDFLMQWKWCASSAIGRNTRYATRSELYTKNKLRPCVKMHRVILKITDPNTKVDHINHDGLDNQKINLRIGTHAQNMMNRTGYGRSKYLGVSADSSSAKGGKIRWVARVSHQKKRIHLGVFDNEIDAALAYNEAAEKYYGEFANLNKIETI